MMTKWLFSSDKVIVNCELVTVRVNLPLAQCGLVAKP